MSYHFTKIVDTTFEETIAKIADELKKEGFGILTEIDVKDTLKKKLDVDFRKYKILGACNPPFAYKALSEEDNIGVLMPCHVVVQEKDAKVHVSAVNPMESMNAVKNPALEQIAGEITSKLKKVISNL